jgi:hypothetical protein
MNKTITRFLTGTFLLLFFAGLTPMMGQSEEQIEKFKKERKIYFTENLELSDQEAKAFWPLYEDFSNRKMKLVEDERNTYSYAHKNAENLSDQEILDILKKVNKLKEDQLRLEAEYYQDKFLKALPAKKVLKLGKVEWDFRRHLMRELRGQDRGVEGKNRGGQGGGEGSGLKGSQESPPLPHPPMYYF